MSTCQRLIGARVSSRTSIQSTFCLSSTVGLNTLGLLDGAVVSHYEVISHPEIFDGVRVHPGQPVAVIRHNARVILSCERVILNFLQQLSGIATLTRKFVEAISGTKARISRSLGSE